MKSVTMLTQKRNPVIPHHLRKSVITSVPLVPAGVSIHSSVAILRILASYPEFS